jgi:LysM repeat protein
VLHAHADQHATVGTGDVVVSQGALMAQEGPEGIPDTYSAPKSTAISSYTVRAGDTLSEIAEMHDVSQNTILWSNNLKSATDIHPGDVLIILPVSGVNHVVKKGETLASLAKDYHGDAADIASFNGLDADASLVVGSTVIIPGGELTAPKPAAGSKSAGTSAKSPAAPKGLAGTGGKDLSSFWTSNPLARAILTQGIHDTNAVDLGAPVGSAIRAIGPGTVIFVSTNGSYNHGWGNDVIIDHGNGVQTLYAHMSTVSASVGQKVSGGTVIGAVGMTGDTTGPHLHLEVRGAKNPFGACGLRSVCSL